MFSFGFCTLPLFIQVAFRQIGGKAGGNKTWGGPVFKVWNVIVFAGFVMALLVTIPGAEPMSNILYREDASKTEFAFSECTITSATLVSEVQTYHFEIGEPASERAKRKRGAASIMRRRFAPSFAQRAVIVLIANSLRQQQVAAVDGWRTARLRSSMMILSTMNTILKSA